MTDDKVRNSPRFESVRNWLESLSPMLHIVALIEPLAAVAIVLAWPHLGELWVRMLGLLTCVVLVFTMWYVVYWVTRDTAARVDRPFTPTWLWRILYNRLPVALGRGYPTIAQLNVLRVRGRAQPNLMEAADELKGNGIRVRDCFVGERRDESVQQLEAELSRATAVLVLWSEELRAIDGVAQALLRWSSTNMDKPILVVDLLRNSAYDLPFRSVPHGNAPRGIELLMTRAIERASSWQHQAQLIHRALAAIFLCLTALAITSGIIRTHDRHRIEQLRRWQAGANGQIAGLRSEVVRRTVSTSSANEGLGVKLSEFREVLSVARSPAELETARLRTQALLSQYAIMLDGDICSWYQIPSDALNRVSFWRLVGVVDSLGHRQMRVTQVAVSRARRFTSMNDDLKSVIGAAFNREDLMYWTRDTGKAGQSAAWHDGKSDGVFLMRDHRLAIDLGSGVVASLAILQRDKDRQGLVCLARAAADRGTASGVLIDAKVDPARLLDPQAQNLLENCVDLLNAVPTELLISKDVVAGLADSGYVYRGASRWHDAPARITGAR